MVFITLGNVTGSLLTKYGIDSDVDLELAAAFCVGTIIMGLGC
jgi:hypothetical protein